MAGTARGVETAVEPGPRPGTEREPGEPRGAARPWLRPPRMRAFDVGERHATVLELFFDLCFVAAVAALASDLHGDPTPGGALRFAGLFVPVWWAWMGFTWYATAYDTDDALFRLAMLGAMLAVIGLSASVAGVAGGATTGFVLAYAAMKLILAGLYYRSWRHAREARPYCARYGLSNLLGAALWLASLLVPPPARYAVWAVAMLVLMAGPVLATRSYAGQAYDSVHIPERYGLFTLIVLGESIVAVSAGTADAGWSAPVALAAVLGFGLAATVWWLYFSFVNAGALSRDHLWAGFTWGYGQLLIFAGIAAAAVGVEFAIEGVAEHHGITAVGAATLGGGVAAFLVAVTAIHGATVRTWDAVAGARLGAAGAAVALAVAGQAIDPLLLLGLLLALLVALTLFEAGLASRGAHGGVVPAEPPLVQENA